MHPTAPLGTGRSLFCRHRHPRPRPRHRRRRRRPQPRSNARRRRQTPGGSHVWRQYATGHPLDRRRRRLSCLRSSSVVYVAAVPVVLDPREHWDRVHDGRPRYPRRVTAAAAATKIRGGKRISEARVQPCVRSHGPGGCRHCRRAAAATATIIIVIAVVLVPNRRKMPPMRRQHRVQVGDGTEVQHEGMASSDAPPPSSSRCRRLPYREGWWDDRRRGL